MNCENNNYENESTNIDEILANSQNGVIEALKIINNQNKKRDAKIEILTGDINSTKTKVESLEKNTNVICSPFHSKRKRNYGTGIGGAEMEREKEILINYAKREYGNYSVMIKILVNMFYSHIFFSKRFMEIQQLILTQILGMI